MALNEIAGVKVVDHQHRYKIEDQGGQVEPMQDLKVSITTLRIVDKYKDIAIKFL